MDILPTCQGDTLPLSYVPPYVNNLLISIKLVGQITESHFYIIFEQLNTRFFMISTTEIVEEISLYYQLGRVHSKGKPQM